MPDVLVRDVDETAIARLKEKAKVHGRSLGVELKSSWSKRRSRLTWSRLVNWPSE